MTCPTVIRVTTGMTCPTVIRVTTGTGPPGIGLPAGVGDAGKYVRKTGATPYVYELAEVDADAAAAAPVQSVAGRTGAVTIGASDVIGLAAVATSGAYANLSGRPTISGTNTGDQDLSGLMAKASNLADLLDPIEARANIGAARAGTISGSGLTLAGLTLIGRYSTGVGGPQEISLGAGLSFTGSVLNGFDRTAPGAIGGTTPASGAFTALSASSSLLVPNTTGTAVGHVYRNADTLRYRDSANAERLLLNATDNLSDLASTATARTNLGIGALTPDGSGNLTLSARFVCSVNGAASAPPVSLTGTWFSGGTSTTTKPQYLIEPAGTSSTNWSTTGTGFGVNAPSGFAGNLLDLQLAGSSNFRVDSTGRITAATLTIGLGGQTSVATNTALGYQALNSASLTGGYSVAIGYYALRNNTTGLTNVAIGYQALLNNTTGTSNNACGLNSLANNTTGNNNNAFGKTSLMSNINGFYNSAFGGSALLENTTGSNNSAFGYNSLVNNVSGSSNTAMGASIFRNTTGSYNVAAGERALFENISGNNSVAFGYQALYRFVSTGSQVAIGYSALQGGSATPADNTGINNIGIGFQAGDSITSGSTNIAIGYDADVDSPTASNQINIGNTYYHDRIIGSKKFTGNIGFFNATAVAQPTAVADATDAASTITQLNALLAKLRTLGLIAT